MTYDEAKEEIRKYFTAMQERQQAEAAKVGEQNRKLGEAYLADNAKRPGIVTTASGLQYEVLTQGDGTRTCGYGSGESTLYGPFDRRHCV